MEGTKGSAGRGRIGLIAILGVALLLRLLWWTTTVSVIEAEGAEYARIARNLFDGRGYEGLFGPNVISSPLYPVLIGIVGAIVGNLEIAGRLVSLASGLGLVAVLFLVARRLFGERAGLIAGLLAATHPVLVGLSVSMFTESLSMALTMLGVYFAIEAGRTNHLGHALAAGAVLGLGYWARPELLLFAGLLSTVAVIGTLRHSAPRRSALWVAAVPVIVAGVIAAPYIVHLSSMAGQFQWEGKSALNEITNARMRAGMDYSEASHGLGASIDPEPAYEEGPYLTADQRVFLRAPRPPLGGQLRVLLRPWRVRMTVTEVWRNRFLGSPTIVVLAALGFLLSGWWRREWLAGLLLAAFGVAQVAMFLAVEHHYDRYFFLLVPMLIPWTAAGIDTAAARVTGLLFARGADRWRTTVTAAVGAVAAILLSAAAFAPTRGTGELRETLDESAKAAGLWIRDDAQRRGVMRPTLVGFGSATAFYADAVLVYPPYSAPDLALEYVQRQRPDFIALRSWERVLAPYAGDWVTAGIPSPCAEPAFQARSSTGATVRVWRWTCR